MNTVFGIIDSNKKRRAARIGRYNKYVDTHFKAKVTELSSDEKSSILHTKNNGVLTGIATKEGVTLLLNGFIYKPLPGWKGKDSPVDDPNKTAEYLLERYKKLGSNLTKDIYGHFSIFVFDKKANKTLVIRDPSGQNDVFYYQDGDTLLFSNKVRIIAEALGPDLELDRSYEDFFLIYGFYPEHRTMYKNVLALPKQSVLSNTKDKTSISEVPCTKPPTAGDIKSEDVLIEKLYEHIVQATKDMLPTNEKKVAVLLGGFDSALVASLLKEQGKEVETFSFYYEDDKYNQAHTDTVADFLGIKHNWVKITDKTIQRGLEEFSYLFNQPTNWPSYVIQTAYLCDVIREKGFKYCYTGDGCDALFYGYPLTFKRAQVLSKIGALPNPMLSAMIKAAERPLLERTLGRPYQVGLGALRSAKRDEATRTLLTFRVFDELSLKQLRSDRPPQAEPTEKVAARLAEHHKGKSVVGLGYEGKKMVSPNKNKMNGSADLSGLIIASPYMHYIVGSFAKTIPDELLRPGESKVITGKYILSKMAEKKKLLPYEVIYQPKIGAADSPIEHWYQGPLRKAVDKQLDKLPFDYSKKYVNSLIRETRAEKAYGKLISKDTSSIVTLSHCISLLTTYAHYTNLPKGNEK